MKELDLFYMRFYCQSAYCHFINTELVFFAEYSFGQK